MAQRGNAGGLSPSAREVRGSFVYIRVRLPIEMFRELNRMAAKHCLTPEQFASESVENAIAERRESALRGNSIRESQRQRQEWRRESLMLLKGNGR